MMIRPFSSLGHASPYELLGPDRTAAGISLVVSICLALFALLNFSIYMRSGLAFWLGYITVACVSLSVVAASLYPFNGRESIFRKKVYARFSDLANSEQRKGSSQDRRNFLLVVVAVLAISITFSLLQIALAGSIQHQSDETLYLDSGKQLVEGVRCNITDNVSGIFQFGFQNNYLNGNGIYSTCNLEHPFFAKLLFGIFGGGVSLALGTASIPLVTFIAWKLSKGNLRATVLAAAFMALDPMFFGMSGMTLLDVISIFFTIASFAVLVSERFGLFSRLSLSGALLGLSILSKETAVFVLPALLFSTFLLFPELGVSLKKQILVFLVSSVGVVVAGLQIYAWIFTPFPTFLSQLVYILQYGSAADIIRLNAIQFPYITLVSVFPMNFGRNLILDIFAGSLFFVWAPIAAYRIYARKDGPKLFEVSLIWLGFPYAALSLLWFLGRTIIAYYAVQLVPPIALGAAYVLSGKRIPLWVVAITMLGAILWFVIFVINPTHISFWYNSPINYSD